MADRTGMEGWVLGFAAAAAAAWAVWRVRRRNPLRADLTRFLVRLQRLLADRYPDVVFRGMIPGEFAVLLEVGGQETPVPLHEAWQRARAFPDDFEGIIAQWMREVRELGLDRVSDHDFEDVAHCILPQIRSRAWLEAKGVFGDSGLAYRPLGDDLVVAYVIDDRECMVFVCRAHLRRWRRSEADLYHLATGNLQRAAGFDVQEVLGNGEPVVLHSGDGYDAARLLLLRDAAPPDLLVAVPDRDLLWLGGAEGSDLADLMSASEQLNRQAAHPVSPRVYRLVEGRLEGVSARTSLSGARDPAP